MNAIATAEAPIVDTEDVIPESADPEMLHEIVDGKYVEIPLMSALAEIIAGKLFVALTNHVDAARLGTAVMELMFRLTALPGVQKRRPDVAFVSAERWPLDLPIPRRGSWIVAPDLAIEVISPNDTDEKIHEKLREYFAAAVGQVWLARPGVRTIAVYDSMTRVRIYGEHDDLDGGEILPGFRLRVGSVFPMTEPDVDATA